jgi:hypothetical protein
MMLNEIKSFSEAAAACVFVIQREGAYFDRFP